MSEPMWRVDRSQPINIYYGGEYVAVAFSSPAVAAAIVARMNEDKPVPPEVGVDWQAVQDALEDVPPSAAGTFRGAFDVLLGRLKTAVDGLEAYMRYVHDDCESERLFEECRRDRCVVARTKLDELRGIGE